MTLPTTIIVSGAWMQACGYGTRPRRLRVLSVQDFGPGRRIFTAEINGRAWDVWEVRCITEAQALAARLATIRQRADDRAYRIARRYRYSMSEFPELRAFFERHRCYANRAWQLAFWLTEQARGTPSPHVMQTTADDWFLYPVAQS